jgi:hypothetical protein
MTSVSESLPASKKITEMERASLERLLASETISKAPRLQAVLRFIINSLLEGRTDQINEQAIGEDVFGRPAGYNPADDNIVRVTVRHLRARLEEFYKTEGRNETCILEIPKGKYIPVLVSRVASQPELPPDPAPQESNPATPVEASPETQDQGELAAAEPSRRPIWWGLTALLLLGNIALLFTLYGAPRYKLPSSSPSAREQGALQLLLQHGNRITVVLTDSNLQAYREIFKKQVPLDAYIDRSYGRQQPGTLGDPALTGAWHYATGTTETSVTSALVAAEIQKAAGPAVTVDIKHPHELSMRDLQRENLVLLGGPWINPWGQMFENRLNFRVLPRDGVPAGSEIQNREPISGEPRVFAPHQDGNASINYVRIALLPNLSNNGRVILIGATSLESLEAGGDFLVSKESVQSLLDLFKVRSIWQLPYFEIVLEVKGIEAVPDAVHIVAGRTVGKPS